MIGRLKGTLIEKAPPNLLMDVQGVGYELQAPMSTFYRLPLNEAMVVLHTHLVIREDQHQLFGFFEHRERELFRLLIKVNGVGPKMALAILSGMDGDAFVRCIQQADIAMLSRVPGIGKKTAERLVIEMRDRIGAMGAGVGQGAIPVVAAETRQSHTAEAESALVALGYKPPEAAKAIARVDAPGLGTEELIRLALKNMISR
jgi:Holliday junction DNA helicase RuvA